MEFGSSLAFASYYIMLAWLLGPLVWGCLEQGPCMDDVGVVDVGWIGLTMYFVMVWHPPQPAPE